MDGKRDSLKVGRDNENINCFFSRTRAQKTQNGVDMLKLTKLTLSDYTEAFMMFERSVETHEIA